MKIKIPSTSGYYEVYNDINEGTGWVVRPWYKSDHRLSSGEVRPKSKTYHVTLEDALFKVMDLSFKECPEAKNALEHIADTKKAILNAIKDIKEAKAA